MALTAAAGAAGTPSAAAIPAAINTAGCYVRCNDGGGDTTQSMTPFHRSFTKATAVSTMSFSGPFRYSADTPVHPGGAGCVELHVLAEIANRHAGEHVAIQDEPLDPRPVDRHRFQQLFFPEGISFDGNGFVRTAVTAPAFSYLRPTEAGNEGLVAQICPRWNPLTSWIRQIEGFQRAAWGGLPRSPEITEPA